MAIGESIRATDATKLTATAAITTAQYVGQHLAAAGCQIVFCKRVY